AMVVDAEAYPDKARDLSKLATALRFFITLGPFEFGTNLETALTDFYPEPLICESEEEDIMYVLYTGGTTGRPKGVVHTHKSCVALTVITLAEWEWPVEYRALASTPISHSSGGFMATSFLRGGTIYFLRSYSPELFVEAVEKHRITTTFLVPTMVYGLLDHPGIRKADFSSLELIIYGAAPMSPSRLAEALEVFGPVFMQVYAQTESTAALTALFKHQHSIENINRLASCGMPLAGVRVKLMDENDNEVPIGDKGEICVRSSAVMAGYWNRPAETAETLRNGWLHTGDIATREASGFLYIVDRKKDMIVSGGFNVFPKEIEDILSSHPSVAMAAVIGVPDEKWGESVKALIVPKKPSTVSPDELIGLVRAKKGPHYAPKSIDFMDNMPVTPLGKPDKKALRKRYWQDKGRHVH
ncbi:MAG: AMP-binding protein, partial [Deltaproteobacteria bacterium]|nr:AMP-binding protein [Deltaproteobacteria bacterium]